MNSSNPQSQLGFVIEIRPVERWAVYHRLQELEIPCGLSTNRPLKVEISSPIAAIQLWSAVKQNTAPRHELVCLLENCWHEKTNIKD
ncbi:hypothetical protein HC931_09450 [Candidatus Gracilibacteria bacterium]|nr:hypothetical protein [Candidatus Gracilibacteria bacterium]NJM87000.1 hypothetical protein [Hydrococcus sp. RU_2_2]NJP18833.1 hypothetical protein [Hydrococcus sp. CRU_1_1]